MKFFKFAFVLKWKITARFAREKKIERAASQGRSSIFLM